MLRQLDELHEPPVGAGAGQLHAMGLKIGAVVVVELIAVAVALEDLLGAVERPGAASLGEHAGILPQAHGAALGRDAPLIGHQVDHRMDGGGVKLRRVGVIPAQHVARELDDGNLHAQADAQVRHAVGAGILRRDDHAFNAPVSKAAGHQDSGTAAEQCGGSFRRDVLGLHPADLHHRTQVGAGVEEGLHHREIGVVELGVLPHQGDLHRRIGAVDSLHHGAPFGEIRRGHREPQLFAHPVGQALPLQEQRHLVEGGGGGIFDDAVLRHIAKERDFSSDIGWNGGVGAADQDVRLDAGGEELLHRVLGGLALQFP